MNPNDIKQLDLKATEDILLKFIKMSNDQKDGRCTLLATLHFLAIMFAESGVIETHIDELLDYTKKITLAYEKEKK